MVRKQNPGEERGGGRPATHAEGYSVLDLQVQRGGVWGEVAVGFEDQVPIKRGDEFGVTPCGFNVEGFCGFCFDLQVQRHGQTEGVEAGTQDWPRWPADAGATRSQDLLREEVLLGLPAADQARLSTIDQNLRRPGTAVVVARERHAVGPGIENGKQISGFRGGQGTIAGEEVAGIRRRGLRCQRARLCCPTGEREGSHGGPGRARDG